jgi:hypothetical protein
VWSLSLGGTPAWQPIVPSGGSAPPARWGHSAIYDAINRQIVIFGGSATAGFYYDDAWALSLGPAVAVGNAGPAGRLTLLSAGPNPARGDWTLAFRTRDAGAFSLRLYDTAGRVVRNLWSGALASGAHSLRWDLRSDSGRHVPSGIYFYELRGTGCRLGKPLVVLGE